MEVTWHWCLLLPGYVSSPGQQGTRDNGQWTRDKGQGTTNGCWPFQSYSPGTPKVVIPEAYKDKTRRWKENHKLIQRPLPWATTTPKVACPPSSLSSKSERASIKKNYIQVYQVYVYHVSSAPKPENVWVSRAQNLGSRSFYGGLFFSISMQKTAKRPNSQPSQTTKAGATTDWHVGRPQNLNLARAPRSEQSSDSPTLRIFLIFLIFSESQSQPDHAPPINFFYSPLLSSLLSLAVGGCGFPAPAWP